MIYRVSFCMMFAALLTAAPGPAPQAGGKPVARVNGSVLTDRDLLREMAAIFPYARQHEGFPKAMEPQIRQGAMQMMVFEELVYQEAVARKMTVPAAKMARADAQFRKQFPSEAMYREFVKEECNGSEAVLRTKIRRSLLIEQMLNVEITSKAAVSLVEAKAYYAQHLDQFRMPESYAVQTISFIPPENANPGQVKEAHKKAEDALRQAKVTKTYDQFGVLAEKISEDNYRVMMGDHRMLDKAKLPPQIAQAVVNMKPGDVSNVIQLGQAYCIVRLNAHAPAGLKTFDDVKNELRAHLEKDKTEKLRSQLRKRLLASAKVEEL